MRDAGALPVVVGRLSTASCRVLESAPPTSALGTMQVFRQVLMQVRQYFDGSDVALLPSVLLVIGSKFVLSHLHLTVKTVQQRLLV